LKGGLKKKGRVKDPNFLCRKSKGASEKEFIYFKPREGLEAQPKKTEGEVPSPSNLRRNRGLMGQNLPNPALLYLGVRKKYHEKGITTKREPTENHLTPIWSRRKGVRRLCTPIY